MEQSHPTTIVVVEDEKITRLAIVKYLDIEGYTVMAAENGEDALRILETQRADLILSDILMPVMDGVVLYEKIQQDSKLRMIPFVFLTCLTDQEHRILGRELGADDYLTKPIDRDVLLASVRGRLKRAASLRAALTKEIEELKKEILNSLSREVKVPVNIIRNLTTLLLTQKVTVSTDQLRDLLSSIKAGGDRLQRGLDDFIMSLELESGAMKQQYEVEKAQQDLWKLVADVVAKSASYADRKNVQVEWTPLSESSSVVVARKQIEYLVDRLVYGAVAPSNPGTRVEISAQVSDRQVILAIKDGSAGFSKADHPYIFEKSHTIRHPYADDYPIGLSLYTSKRLAEINNCDLTCLSQPGKGTTYTLKIPLS